MNSLKSLVAILAACFAVVLIGPASASAAHARHERSSARPCWKDVLNDWLPDARVDHTYQVRCYQQALAHLPPDLRNYSSAEQDFKRALLLATAKNHGKTPPGDALIVGANGEKKAFVAGGPGSSGPGGPSFRAHQPGIFRRVLDWLGPSNANSVPTPLLVLAGIAVLLLLAAAASFLARRLQARRLRPAPQPAPPDRP